MPISTGRLRRYSVRFGVVSLVEAVAAAVVLAVQPRHWVVPVTASYPGMAQPVILARVDIDQGVVWVLGITAVGALLPAIPAYFSRWNWALNAGHNYARWVEFSFSSSIIIFLIAQLNGITDIAALVAIYSVNSAMILFGWLQERYEQPRAGRGASGLLAYVFGSIVGIVPWGIIAWYVLEPGSGRGITEPAWVQVITLVVLALFTGFAVGQWLQYKRVGPWVDYLYGERAYLIWTFVTKTEFALLVITATLTGRLR